MYKYFTNCETLEDVKKLYKKLCFMYHPDISGSDTTATMQAVNSEYERAFNQYKNIFKNAKQETYTKDNAETPEEYKDIINSIIHFEGITIEIIGNWIWLSGNATKLYKDEISKLGFKWSKNKIAWYYHSGQYKKYHNKTFTLDELRYKFGSQEVKTERQPLLV